METHTRRRRSIQKGCMRTLSRRAYGEHVPGIVIVECDKDIFGVNLFRFWFWVGGREWCRGTLWNCSGGPRRAVRACTTIPALVSVLSSGWRCFFGAHATHVGCCCWLENVGCCHLFPLFH